MTDDLRITTTGRTKLETVIPLSTPYLVFLDPSNICNQQCGFCPTGNRELIKKVGRKLEKLSFGLCLRALRQLTEFPDRIKTLRLYKDGEPLLNPDFSVMVAYAKSKNKFDNIDTTTNGTLLTHELSRQIIDAGLTKIFISVHPSNIMNPKYAREIIYFYLYSRDHGNCKVFIKTAGDYLSHDERTMFLDIYSDFCDSIAIEHTASCWPEFDVPGVNKNIGIYGQKLEPTGVDVCPYIFYSISINSNGTVTPCFVDWQHSLTIGDLNSDRLLDIWNGEKLRGIRMAHLLKKRSQIPICKNCGQLIYGLPDNIDQHAFNIWNKIR
jgi:radical SAM protein with 4Fe4S-binding SPASM domain